MAKSKETIINEIEQYIRSNGLLGIFWGYSSWYCGITKSKSDNANRHKKPPKHKFWLCASNNIAREIENHFLSLGMAGIKEEVTPNPLTYMSINIHPYFDLSNVSNIFHVE